MFPGRSISTADFEHIVKKSRLDPNFAKLGPAGKIVALQASSISAVKMGRFIMDTTQLNFIRQVKGCLPPMASAVRCFAAFCALRRMKPAPPSEEMVAQRIAMFKNTDTYYKYVLHLKNDCLFLRITVAWLTPAVRLIAKGMEK